MLSEDFDPWLIEINSSPCMAPSTSITAKMCPRVLEDTLKVVLEKNQGTGLFELVYKQNYVIVPSFLGSTLQVTGKPVFNHARLKQLQRSKGSSNLNRNASQMTSLKKRTVDDSSSDSQSISLPSSRVEQDDDEDDDDDDDDDDDEEEASYEEEDSLQKKKEQNKKRKAFGKAWKNKCCRCRRNGRIKCSCPVNVNLARTLNLTLKLEGSKSTISSKGVLGGGNFAAEAGSSNGRGRNAFEDGDGNPEGRLSVGSLASEDFISGLLEKDFRPETSVAKSDSREMQTSPNGRGDLPRRTLILEPASLSKPIEPRSSSKVKDRKVKKRFVPDSDSRRKSALLTFINHLSLRPVAKKIGLGHIEL